MLFVFLLVFFEFRFGCCFQCVLVVVFADFVCFLNCVWLCVGSFLAVVLLFLVVFLFVCFYS